MSATAAVDESRPKSSSLQTFTYTGGGTNKRTVSKDVSHVVVPSVTEIEEFAFDECKKLTTVELPSTITSIKKNAFSDCSSLVKINLPSSITTIAEQVFYGCSSMKEISLPSSITTIEKQAFQNCFSLVSINIPSSVTKIESRAFSGCSALNTIKLSPLLKTIEKSVFSDCYSLTTINVPLSVTNIERSAFLRCRSLVSISLPPNLSSIGKSAFKECSSLLVLEIPSSVTHIGDRAFKDCTTLLDGRKHDDPNVISWLKRRYSSLPLHKVCSDQDVSVEAVDQCIREKKQNLEGKDELGMTALHTLLCSPNVTHAILQRILVGIPSTVSEKDVNGYCPLHLLLPKITPEILNYLIEANPNVAGVKDCNGRYPIHIACTIQQETAVRMVKRLLDENLSVATKRDCKGECPIHIACYNPKKPAIEIIKSLLFANPNASGTKDDNGRYPLHIACGVDQGTSLEMVKILLDHNPTVAAKRDKYGECPLHIACRNSHTSAVEIVEILLDSNPSATEIMNNSGQYPIHIACGSKETIAVEIVKTLLNENPSLAMERDSKGQYPIHIACRNPEKSAVEIVNNLLMTNPSVSTVKDKNGQYPIHIACGSKEGTAVDIIKKLLSEEIVKKLLGDNTDTGENPNSITERDNNGQCPIHIACSNPHFTPNMLKRMLVTNSTAPAVKDGNGEYPIHLLCKNKQLASYELVMEMINARTDSGAYAILTPDKNDKTPTELAFHHNLSDNAKFCLYSIHPIAMEIESVSWTQFMKGFLTNLMKNISLYKRSELTQHGPVELAKKIEDCDVISFWIDLIKNPNNCSISDIETLANFKDKSGQTLISAAIPEIKDSMKERLLFLARFELIKGPPIHRSETSIIFKVIDHKVKQEADGLSEKRSIAQVANVNKLLVFKLMKEYDQFRREIDSRMDNQLDSNFILHVMNSYETRKDEMFASAIKSHKVPGYEDSSMSYNFAITMPYADSDLDKINRGEKPSRLRIRAYIDGIVKSLKHLHDKGIIHGELKLQNIVRLESKIRLIDLETSTQIEDSDNEPYLSTFKFSSGILPPEMIHEFSNEEELEAFNYYFKNGQDCDNERWKKIAPKKCKGNNRYYAVKTHRIMEGKVFAEESLPYQVVHASVDIDLWSLGTIIYSLYSGRSLLEVDFNDDLSNGDAMCELYSWNDTKRDEKLLLVDDIFARSLLMKLLAKERKERFKNIEEVLSHQFFSSSESALSERTASYVNEEKNGIREEPLIKRTEKRTSKEREQCKISEAGDATIRYDLDDAVKENHDTSQSKYEAKKSLKIVEVEKEIKEQSLEDIEKKLKQEENLRMKLENENQKLRFEKEKVLDEKQKALQQKNEAIETVSRLEDEKKSFLKSSKRKEEKLNKIFETEIEKLRLQKDAALKEKEKILKEKDEVIETMKQLGDEIKSGEERGNLKTELEILVSEKEKSLQEKHNQLQQYAAAIEAIKVLRDEKEKALDEDDSNSDDDDLSFDDDENEDDNFDAASEYFNAEIEQIFLERSAMSLRKD